MQHSLELDRVSSALVLVAGRTPSEASIASRLWPTAGDMVDHVGTIQRWATAVLRTGASANEAEHERPDGRDRTEWLAEGAAALTAQVAAADPDEPCWTFVGPDRKAFWGRRMIHEAAKHLWDLRTAVDPTPPLPPELGPDTPADIIDEFEEVFIARARRNGVAPMPGSVLLQPIDSHRRWLVHPDWSVEREPSDAPTAGVLAASTADLALVLWERADPFALPDRFTLRGDRAAIRALSTTPIHL